MEGTCSTALHLLDLFLSLLPGAAVLGGWGFDFDPLKLDRETLEPFEKIVKKCKKVDIWNRSFECWIQQSHDADSNMYTVYSTHMCSMLDFI